MQGEAKLGERGAKKRLDKKRECEFGSDSFQFVSALRSGLRISWQRVCFLGGSSIGLAWKHLSYFFFSLSEQESVGHGADCV